MWVGTPISLWGFPPLGCVCPYQFKRRICSPTIICSHQICLVNFTTLHIASYCHLEGRGVAPVGYVIGIITCVTYRKWPGASPALLVFPDQTQILCQPPFFSECGTYHLTCYNTGATGATCTAQVHTPAAEHLSACLKLSCKMKKPVFFLLSNPDA